MWRRRTRRAGGGSPYWLRLPGLEEVWTAGRGEAKVAGNLDVWTGIIGNAPLAAPAPGNRPTPAAKGWTFAAASQSVLIGASAVAASKSGNAPYSVGIALDITSNSACPWMFCDPTSDVLQHNLFRSTGTTWMYRRRTAAGIASVTGTGPAAGTPASIWATFDGTLSRLFVNGVLVGGPTALARDPAGLTRVALGAAYDLTPSNFASGTIAELVTCTEALPESAVRYASAWQNLRWS